MTGLLISVLGGILFLFIFWRRLKEDYSSQIIFSTAFSVMLGLGLGYFVSFKAFPQWFFWGGFLGMLAGLFVSVLRLRIRFYESLEALVISVLPLLSFVFLADSVANSSLVSFLSFVTVLFIIFVFLFLDGRYREFTWYKSGKIGFVGLATMGTFFLIRSGVAIFFHSVLSFVGKSEVIVSGALAFLSFLLLFNLGRQE